MKFPFVFPPNCVYVTVINTGYFTTLIELGDEMKIYEFTFIKEKQNQIVISYFIWFNALIARIFYIKFQLLI